MLVELFEELLFHRCNGIISDSIQLATLDGHLSRFGSHVTGCSCLLCWKRGVIDERGVQSNANIDHIDTNAGIGTGLIQARQDP